MPLESERICRSIGLAQPLRLQHARARGGAPSASGTPFSAGQEGDGGDRRHAAIEAALLRQEADAVAHLAHIAGVPAPMIDAGGGRDQAEDHADGRGLAGAVGAKKPQDAAGLNLKAQVRDRVKSP